MSEEMPEWLKKKFNELKTAPIDTYVILIKGNSFKARACDSKLLNATYYMPLPKMEEL